MNLIQFLEARITDDENAATHQREAAECKAKRAIVEDTALLHFDRPHLCDHSSTLRHLASVYAAHEDYDPAWAPA